MNYVVTDFQVGLYDCDTLFIQVDNDIVQVPVSKKANVAQDIVGKKVAVDNLYNVPLMEVVVVTTK